MKNQVNVIEIKNFWDWFSKNSQNFGNNFENTVLLNELDTRVSKLGHFSWEVGPGKIKDNELVISPNGNIELLQVTKEIIAKAKENTNWEYYYAKPPKQWNLKFEFKTSNGVQVKIDASNWKYFLLQYEDGMFEIIIRAQRLNKLSNEDRLSVAEIVLDGVLGEERRMLLIDKIDVVNEFDKLDKNKANNLNDLSEHLSVLQV